MRPMLSIIVPVYREPFMIGRCLAYLASCPGIDRCEVIICEGDGGASMPPEHIVPIRRVRTVAGRGVQLNAGAKAARADLLAFLHVDTTPPRGFVRMIERALSRREAGAFDLHVETRHPFVSLVSLVGLVRSRLTRLPYGDQMQFVRRSTFREIDGFPRTPIMEDVGLMDRLRDSGRRIAIVRPPVRTSDRRWSEEGALRSTLRNWRIMLAYRSGRSVSRLSRRYRPQSDLRRDRRLLIVFHRALRHDGVKTRLAACVGAESALILYRAMIDDLLTRLTITIPRVFFIDDPHAGVDRPGNSIPQCGENLWERMDDAIRRAIAGGADRIVLIGSDIPGLSRAIIRSAFGRLARSAVVLGPSADGGFYLVGCASQAYAPEMFAAARSDPGRSAELVREWAAGRDLRVDLLPTLRDVDTLDELRLVLGDRNVRAPHLRRAARRLDRRGRLTFPILKPRRQNDGYPTNEDSVHARPGRGQ